MRSALLAVAALALACLLIRAARVGLAGDYIDPVGKITAQDEALYAHSAIHMATQGGWLTPMFMGRYALYKPPMLAWLAGASARILGVSRLALRLPAALLCALALGLVFLWAAEARGWIAGTCAAALLLSDHLWHVLGGMCMTDGLLVAFYIAGLYTIFSDPWLESRSALWGFAASTAAAILTKSIAGVLPLAALGLYWLAAPHKYRPRLGRVCLAASLALALAAPWFVWQLVVHHRWFWTEAVLVEILGFGAGAPPQTSQENQAVFYLLRLAILDPVLLALVAVAAPGWFRALRRRSPDATLLAIWIGLVLASVMVWQYRNASYLLPAIPMLAIVAAVYGSSSNKWSLGLCGIAFVCKAALAAAPWGISFAAGTVQPVAPIVSDYCRMARGNELILVGMDDDLYATTLPLAKLRYALVGSFGPAGEYGMDFAGMGIILTAAQFDDLRRREPVFRDRLREWGLDSAAPIGTLIAPSTPGELAEISVAHPESDFLVPGRFRAAIGNDAGHEVREAAPGHFLLLSRKAIRGSTPAWSCGM